MRLRMMMMMYLVRMMTMRMLKLTLPLVQLMNLMKLAGIITRKEEDGSEVQTPQHIRYWGLDSWILGAILGLDHIDHLNLPDYPEASSWS